MLRCSCDKSSVSFSIITYCTEKMKITLTSDSKNMTSVVIEAVHKFRSLVIKDNKFDTNCNGTVLTNSKMVYKIYLK